MAQTAFWATCASAVAILFSIAASQILMGIGIAAFLLSRERVRLPRPALPLALFLALTLISLVASGDPRAGLPQVKKLYVYLMLALVYSVVRRMPESRNLLLACCAVAGADSILGIFQFIQKWREAQILQEDFYNYYLPARITGFMSHWMTFSGEQMLVLVILIAFLLFGNRPSSRIAQALWLLGAGAMSVALVLGDTRSTWLAAFGATLYLAWSRRKLLALAVPLIVLAGFTLAPQSIRERASSILRPHGDLDSNEFRVVVWKTGLRMIRAHPLLGLGPEMVHKHFYEWLPPDAPRPLPPGYYGHLHSIYIHYAAERGIPAVLMLMWMFGMMLFDFTRALRRLPPGRGDARFLLHAGVACVIAVMIEGAFELNMGDSEVLTMFLTITACCYVAVGSARRQEAAA